MAPVKGDIKSTLQDYIDKNKVMMFSKSYCPFCHKIKELFKSLSLTYKAIELDKIDNGNALQSGLLELSGQKTVPNVYINGKHIGGCDDTLKLHADNKLMSLVSPQSDQYDYDLVVVGGGSGGLAASK